MLCSAAYCVVADESAGRQVPMAFLERVKQDFVTKYSNGKAATAPANSLDKEFGYCTLAKFTEHKSFLLANYLLFADQN